MHMTFIETGLVLSRNNNLWAEHQKKKILVIKPIIDNRYSDQLLITHNNLSHECFVMTNWDQTNKKYALEKQNFDVVFLDEVQFMDASETIDNVENMLNNQIDVICAGLDQDSRGHQ